MALSIAISGFLLFTLSTLGVVVSYLIIRFFAVYFSLFATAGRAKAISRLQEYSGRRIALIIGANFFVLPLAYYAGVWVGKGMVGPSTSPDPLLFRDIVLVVTVGFSSLGILILFRPVYLNRILAIFYVVLTLMASFGMFIDGVFDTFLRWIRFGGGIEITMQRKDKPEVKAYLFLHTQDRVILYDPTKAGFFEVPTNEVDSYAYDQYPDWKLPPPSLREQGKYVRY